MKPVPYNGARSHGDLHTLEVIEGKGKRYIKGRFLGKGGFAKCYEVRDMETGEFLAAKIVSKASITKPRAHEKLRSEIAIHRSLDHDKVVKFVDYFEDNENVYIILELCPNQTLNEFMRKRPGKRLSEAEAMFYIYDLIMALKYLRRRRVIHRDLKLGNLFLDADARMKVGDFGLAAQLEHDGDKKRTICGTPNYIAPEILDGRYGHSYEVDIWSLGVIIYTMLFGRPPFETSDVKTTYRKIRHNQYTFPETVPVSDSAKDLISCILRSDPRLRPSLDEIIGSPWFHEAPQFPPPVPTTVSAVASASPRVNTARSETPERGMPDFARIDSPAPHYPLRDRSPSAAPSPHSGATHQPPQHNLPRGQSATPSLRTKQPLTKQDNGPTTPGRQPSGGLPGGRPPLVLRGNEENIVPMNNACGGGCGGGEKCINTPLSPVVNQVQAGIPAAPCRTQSANLTSSGSSARLQVGTPNSAPASRSAQNLLHGQSGASALRAKQVPGTGDCGATTPGRNPSAGLLGGRPPLAHRGNDENLMPASQVGGGAGGGTDKCTASAALVGSGSQVNDAYPGGNSPPPAPCYAQGCQLTPGSVRQTSQAQPSAVRSARLASTACRDSSPLQGTAGASASQPRRFAPNAAAPKESRSARALGSSNSEGGTYSGSLLARTTCTAVLRGTASPPPCRLDSNGAPSGARQQFTPGGEAEGARTPLGAPSLPTTLDRKQFSARTGSPAHFFDVVQTEPMTPTLHGQDGSARTESTKGLGIVASGGASSGRLGQQSGGSPELWVTKWVDYSSKYGVGYTLSDGSLGVYFNDSTKVILVGGRFDYITRRTQERPEVRSTYTFDEYPEDLKKKVTLLRHFKNYMSSDALEKKDGATVGESGLPQEHPKPASVSESSQAAYVKKWTRNKHAILFQLSNKIVQVMFFDKTEAVLSSRSHTVTYVDKRGHLCEYPLSSALDVPNAELSKRLRYTRDILVNLLGIRTTDLAAAAQ